MSFKQLKMTDYFKNSILRKRPEFLDREDDIILWIDHPSHIVTQSDGRKKYYARDLQECKWVRIILLEDGKTIHNIFYDRNFKG
ncbi:MAG: hypothetical protein ACOYOK_07640 [Pseudobdellovibrionaceae bacterium]